MMSLFIDVVLDDSDDIVDETGIDILEALDVFSINCIPSSSGIHKVSAAIINFHPKTSPNPPPLKPPPSNLACLDLFVSYSRKRINFENLVHLSF